MSNETETLGDTIQNQIDNAVETLPKPHQCTITKKYSNDPNHVDIMLEDGSTLKAVPLIGINTVGLSGILLFLNGDETKPLAITTFQSDNQGGISIDGAGIILNGNGLFPHARLTHSIFTDENDDTYALLGLIDNAYHTLNGCDDNSTYSWFFGLKTPCTGLTKNNTNTSFVVMYNDTTDDDKHVLNIEDWHIVFEVNKNGVVE